MSAVVNGQLVDKIVEAFTLLHMLQYLGTVSSLTASYKMEELLSSSDPLLISKSILPVLESHVNQIYSLVNSDNPRAIQNHIHKLFHLLWSIWLQECAPEFTMEYIIKTGIQRNMLISGFNCPLATATSLTSVRAMMATGELVCNPVSRIAPIRMMNKLVVEEAARVNIPITLPFQHPQEILEMLRIDNRGLYLPGYLSASSFPQGAGISGSPQFGTAPESSSHSSSSLITEYAPESNADTEHTSDSGIGTELYFHADDELGSVSPPRILSLEEMQNNGANLIEPEEDLLHRNLSTPPMIDEFRDLLLQPDQPNEHNPLQILPHLFEADMDDLLAELRNSAI